MLITTDLTIKIDGQSLVKNASLSLPNGEIHLLMGPNGAGKSSLAKAIMGLPDLTVKGDIKIGKKDIGNFSMEERALAGIYLAYQSPIEVPGVRIIEFLRTTYNMRQKEEDRLDPWAFAEIFESYGNKLGLPQDLPQRNLNEGFSGGEKKKAEILQMLLLEPKYALLDEIDSGLDLDALKVIFSAVQEYSKESNAGILIISHNPNILDYITPDKVHLMIEGEITKTDGPKLVKEIVKKGYAST